MFQFYFDLLFVPLLAFGLGVMIYAHICRRRYYRFHPAISPADAQHEFAQRRLDSLSLGVLTASYVTLYSIWRLHGSGVLRFDDPDLAAGTFRDVFLLVTGLLVIDYCCTRWGPHDFQEATAIDWRQRGPRFVLSFLRYLAYAWRLREATGLAGLSTNAYLLVKSARP